MRAGVYLGFWGVGLTLGLSVVLAGCGQKGPLVSSSDHQASSKAIYLIKPKMANGEVTPNPQTDFSEQSGMTQ